MAAYIGVGIIDGLIFGYLIKNILLVLVGGIGVGAAIGGYKNKMLSPLILISRTII